MSYRFIQGSEARREEGFGGDPEDWQVVCEELRANAPTDSELPRSLRKQLEGCVAWAELWSGAVPSRDSVRRALEPFTYRPVAD